MTPEEKLQVFFAAQKPTEPDLSFDLVLMARMAKSRALASFVRKGVLAVFATGLGFAGLMAVQTSDWASFNVIAASAGAALIAGIVLWTLHRA